MPITLTLTDREAAMIRAGLSKIEHEQNTAAMRGVDGAKKKADEFASLYAKVLVAPAASAAIRDALATLDTMLTHYAVPGKVPTKPMPQADIDARWAILTKARAVEGVGR